jgi:integrase/recombinase XerD
MLLHVAVNHYIAYLKDIDRAYETVKGYRSELNSLSDFIVQKYNGPVYLIQLCANDLEEYVLSLKKKGCRAVSRNRSVYIMRAFFKYCCKKKFLSANPANELEIVPAPVVERVFLTCEETAALISSIREPLARVIVETLFFTGMRISECLGLRPGDVDIEHGIIRVKNTKNRVDRSIPMHSRLKEILAQYEAQHEFDKDRRFFFSRGERGVSADYVNRVLRETTQTLKWDKRVTCHIIRHSFASSLVLKNVNIVSIQKLLGHSSLSTTSIYTHTSMKDLEEVINKINAI